MEPDVMIGWQQERAGLQMEVCRLQEELAETRASRDQLESRTRALTERLVQAVSFAPLEEEQRGCRRKMRESREREARQALLIHRLQNKVLEYRERVQRLESQVQEEHTQLINTEQKLRDEHSDSLESALIRLEEEQQRSEALALTNTLLREQLNLSEHSNATLREDLQKLTLDWTRAVEGAEQQKTEWQLERENGGALRGQQQATLLSLWRAVVLLKRHCHTVKTASDRDLWQLRADFSRLSTSLMSSCSSLRLTLSKPASEPTAVSSSPLIAPQSPLSPLHAPLSPPSLSSTMVSVTSDPPPQTPMSPAPVSLGTFHLNELDHEGDSKIGDNNEVKQLKEQLESLSVSLLEQRQEAETLRQTESKLRSVSEALLRLPRFLNSPSPAVSFESVLALDLSSMLEIISQTESNLQRNNHQLQMLEQSVRGLGEDKTVLQRSLNRLETEQHHQDQEREQTLQELRLSQDSLRREQESGAALRSQVEDLQVREEDLRKERDRLRRERERDEERGRNLEEKALRRVEQELMENVQLTERERLLRLEIHRLKVELEREQLDRQRAEGEAADTRDALTKSRESELHLSSSQTVLKRQLDETQDALDKMSALSSSLASDKRDLNSQLQQMETELTDSQSQLQTLNSEVSGLQRELKAVEMYRDELRAQREADTKLVQQLRGEKAERERVLDDRKRALRGLEEERQSERQQLEQLSSQNMVLQKELQEVQELLKLRGEEVRRRERSQNEQLRETRRIRDEQDSERRQREELHQELLDTRSYTLRL